MTIMLTIVCTVCATILGAMWRRWFGSSEGSGHGMRFVKHLVGFILFFLVAWFGTNDYLLAASSALVFSVGMSFGHTFDPWQPLVWRYGAVSVAVALWMIGFGLVVGTFGFTRLDWSYAAYAPFGLLTPLGYIFAKKRLDRDPDFCWTCVGEYWMGAILVGPVPLLRLL